jgi:hypothetical protein
MLNKTCTWTVKTAPCFAHFGLSGNVTKNTQQHATVAGWLLAKNTRMGVFLTLGPFITGP